MLRTVLLQLSCKSRATTGCPWLSVSPAASKEDPVHSAAGRTPTVFLLVCFCWCVLPLVCSSVGVFLHDCGCRSCAGQAEDLLGLVVLRGLQERAPLIVAPRRPPPRAGHGSLDELKSASVRICLPVIEEVVLDACECALGASECIQLCFGLFVVCCAVTPNI